MKPPVKKLLMLALMVLSAGLAAALRPTILLADELAPIQLKTLVPAAFGDWREQLMSTAQIIDPQTQQKLAELYSETLTRTYINRKGYQIMLSIAYGKNQSAALQLHKPEVCYPAQGFMLVDKQPGEVVFGNTTIPTTRLMTTLGQRKEPVTYWTVVGAQLTTNHINKKLAEMRYAIRNRIPDGMLVRVSSIDADPGNAYEYHNQFASQMLAAITPAQRERVIGHANASLPVTPSP